MAIASTKKGLDTISQTLFLPEYSAMVHVDIADTHLFR